MITINVKPLIAQINFIPDPSFEIIDSCPKSISELSPVCRYWFTETTYMLTIPVPPYRNWRIIIRYCTLPPAECGYFTTTKSLW